MEKGDYASGTSSRSSKLVHGGLRYLQNFDLGLVREALLERQINVALAPHLVRPLPLIVPAFDGARPGPARRPRAEHVRRDGGRPAAPPPRAHARTTDWSPARHRVIDGAEVRRAAARRSPAARPSGGYLFYDCQTDDVRLVLTVLAEAERFGAVPANGVEAVALTEAGGAPVRASRAGGEEFEVRAANVVNATGVWADRLRPEELHDEAEVPGHPAQPRHAHASLPSALLPLVGRRDRPGRRRARRSSCCPWLGQTLVGTTDNDYEGDLEHVQPGRRRRRATCSTRSTRSSPPRWGRGDVAGAYAGVRPLISTGDPKKSVDISRKAELYETSSGMVTITGGKLTTWRRMAKLTVDRIVEREGRDAPCRTHEIPLGMAVEPAALPRVAGVADEAYAQLAGRYGYARARGAAARRRAARAGRSPWCPAGPTCSPRRSYAARREQARTVGDVLLRRTRLGLTAARELCAPGAPAPERVAARDGGGARLGRGARGGGGGRVPRGGARRGHRGGGVSAPAAHAARRPAGGSSWAATPLLMGIVNATPDSFSDAGELPDVEARRRARRARCSRRARDILDVGGESAFGDAPAGAGARRRSARVVPVSRRLAAELTSLVSVDTYKPAVAEAAVAAGAAIVNDVSGLRDPALAASARATGAGARGHAHARGAEGHAARPGLYDDVVADVRGFLRERMAVALAAGVRDEQIAARPGPGLRQDAGPDRRGAAPARRAARARAARCCWPVSRKDFLGALTGRAPRDRGAGTLAASARRRRGRARRCASTTSPRRPTSSPSAPRCAASASSRRTRASRPTATREGPLQSRLASRRARLPAAAHNAAGCPPTDITKERPMSSVLDRDGLEKSPLADLHLLANELGVESFRRLRKADLIDAILARQAGDDGRRGADVEPSRRRDRRRRRGRAGAGRSRRGRRGGRRAARPRAPTPTPRPRPTTRPRSEGDDRRGRSGSRGAAAPRRRGGRGRGRDEGRNGDDREDARREPPSRAARTRSPRASSSCSPTARASSASRRRSPPTTTSTSRPRRSSAASSSRATASAAPCAPRAAPSASRRWSASTRSTAARPTRSPRAPASRTCPPRSRPSASSSAPRTRPSRRSSG